MARGALNTVKIWLIFVGISGFLSVALGAFGAHGLKGAISPSMLEAFRTGTDYQMFHTLALLGLSVWLLKWESLPKVLIVAGYAWVIGIILFSGSLYGLALTGAIWLGPVTPLGGMCLMIGWLWLMWGAICFSRQAVVQ